jgi:hypothetical protein
LISDVFLAGEGAKQIFVGSRSQGMNPDESPGKKRASSGRGTCAALRFEVDGRFGGARRPSLSSTRSGQNAPRRAILSLGLRNGLSLFRVLLFDLQS